MHGLSPERCRAPRVWRPCTTTRADGALHTFDKEVFVVGGQTTISDLRSMATTNGAPERRGQRRDLLRKPQRSHMGHTGPHRERNTVDFSKVRDWNHFIRVDEKSSMGPFLNHRDREARERSSSGTTRASDEKDRACEHPERRAKTIIANFRGVIGASIIIPNLREVIGASATLWL